MEAQQEAAAEISKAKVQLSPEQIARLRAKQGPELASKQVLQQIKASQNPRHQRMLEQALAELERRLAAIE